MSYETVMTAAKIIATAHPIARGVCKCDTPADVSFKDVASTLLDSGWESVLIADKNLLIANTDVARNDYVNAHPKSKFTIYRRQIDKHGIPRKVTEVWGRNKSRQTLYKMYDNLSLRLCKFAVATHAGCV